MQAVMRFDTSLGADYRLLRFECFVLIIESLKLSPHFCPFSAILWFQERNDQLAAQLANSVPISEQETLRQTLKSDFISRDEHVQQLEAFQRELDEAHLVAKQLHRAADQANEHLCQEKERVDQLAAQLANSVPISELEALRQTLKSDFVSRDEHEQQLEGFQRELDEAHLVAKQLHQAVDQANEYLRQEKVGSFKCDVYVVLLKILSFDFNWELKARTERLDQLASELKNSVPISVVETLRQTLMSDFVSRDEHVRELEYFQRGLDDAADQANEDLRQEKGT
ncbi:unnamed protein product [Protopolystoma xenopodis]|uniref:Uncharacterized protein n=1 Tax=Protopolystoma xenopodis TaxID=117903 RepID=A0A448XEV1_9PLAT|nr:unnamed protein product [Protopolystoma xenopodis]